MKLTALSAACRFALIGAIAPLLAACEFRQTGETEPAPPEEVEVPVPATQADGPDTASEPLEAEPPAPPEDAPEPAKPTDETVPPLELLVPFPDGADLSPRAERLLESVLSSEALAEGWPVVLGGHTDSSGNDLANLRASRSRAETVAAWLVQRGVADERITVIAFGEQNPIAPNALPDGTSNEEGRRANRRVELWIAPEGSRPQPASTPAENTQEREDA